MNLGKETETLEYKKTTGEMKEAMVSISSILKVLVRKWGDCLKQAKSTVTHYPSPHRSYAVCLWCLLVKACCITALPYLQYAYKQS